MTIRSNFLQEPARHIPIFGEYDVVVVVGGRPAQRSRSSTALTQAEREEIPRSLVSLCVGAY